MQIENKNSTGLLNALVNVGRKISDGSSGASKKMGRLSSAIFNYFHHSYQNFKNYFWPSKKVADITKEPTTYSEKVISQALTLVKNKQIPKEEKVPTIQVNQYATYAYEAAILAAPIYLSLEAQFTGQLSFFNQQASLQAETGVLNPALNAFFGGSIDREHLQLHGMLLKGDQMDHTLYQFGTLTVATIANLVTFNGINVPLHVIFTAIAGMPPVENAIMSLKAPQYISQQAHALNRDVRKSSADFIKPYVVRFIEPQLLSAGAAAEKAFLEKFELATPNLGHVGNKLVKAAVKLHITDPLAENIARGIDSAATHVSDQIVNLTIDQIQQIANSVIQIRLSNNVSKYMKNRFFGGLSLVMAGGRIQSVNEFVLRLLGAGILTATGNNLIPFTIIYTPKMISYAAKLKATLDAIEEEAEGRIEELLDDEPSMEEDTSTDEEKTPVEEIGFMPDPLGFMGGIDLPKIPQSESPPKAASFSSFNSFDTDEVNIDSQSSYLEEIFTSLITAESEIDEDRFYMGM